jgi:hypothetical protein
MACTNRVAGRTFSQTFSSISARDTALKAFSASTLSATLTQIVPTLRQLLVEAMHNNTCWIRNRRLGLTYDRAAPALSRCCFFAMRSGLRYRDRAFMHVARRALECAAVIFLTTCPGLRCCAAATFTRCRIAAASVLAPFLHKISTTCFLVVGGTKGYGQRNPFQFLLLHPFHPLAESLL